MPDLLSAAASDPLPVYLAVTSLATLAVSALDGWRRGRRGQDAGVSHAALSLLSFAGGAAGGVLGFLLFDRRSNKRNVTWHVFSLVALMAWALVLVSLYVGPLDAGALRGALARDHTVLLAYLGGASAVTFVAFVADKLVAMHNAAGMTPLACRRCCSCCWRSRAGRREGCWPCSLRAQDQKARLCRRASHDARGPGGARLRT